MLTYLEVMLLSEEKVKHAAGTGKCTAKRVAK
jgi:hypothetical protein